MRLVSVIITTHNRCKCLKEAIKSVLNQTYKDLELIVVDDASDDETFEFLKSYSDSTLQYIRISNEDSKGGNHARNMGICAAKGEWIAFLDDDDLWLPEKLYMQIKCADKNPDCGLIYCNRIREINNKFAYIQPSTSAFAGNLKKKIFEKIICTTSTIMCKKTCLEKVGGFDESLKFWQEYELLIRLCQITNVGYVDEALVIYRCNYNDINRLSNKYNAWVENTNRIYSKHSNIIEKLNSSEKKNMRLVYIGDAISRAYSCGDKRLLRKNLWMYAMITKGKRDFLNAILGNSPIHDTMRRYKNGKLKVIPDQDYKDMLAKILGDYNE